MPRTPVRDSGYTKYYNGKYQGKGETIVVIDEGESKLFPNANVIYKDHDSPVDKTHGGMVAAVAQKVASQVNIIHLTFTSATDAGEQAFQWVLDHAKDKDQNGRLKYGDIVAVNYSQGWFSNHSIEKKTSLTNEIRKLTKKGIAVTIAAGNDYKEHDQQDGIGDPAADLNAITVSASSNKTPGQLTSYTQRHPILTDISAPGKFKFTDSKGNTTVENATSYAAPFVAGAIADMQDEAKDMYNAKLDTHELLRIIQTTADPGKFGDKLPIGYRQIDVQAAMDYIKNNVVMIHGTGYLREHQDIADTLAGATELDLSIADHFILEGQVHETLSVLRHDYTPPAHKGIYSDMTDFQRLEKDDTRNDDIDELDVYKITLPNTSGKAALKVSAKSINNNSTDIDIYLFDQNAKLVTYDWHSYILTSKSVTILKNVEYSIDLPKDGQSYYIAIKGYGPNPDMEPNGHNYRAEVTITGLASAPPSPPPAQSALPEQLPPGIFDDYSTFL